jgi:hypothetical protein
MKHALRNARTITDEDKVATEREAAGIYLQVRLDSIGRMDEKCNIPQSQRPLQPGTRFRSFKNMKQEYIYDNCP